MFIYFTSAANRDINSHILSGDSVVAGDFDIYAVGCKLSRFSRAETKFAVSHLRFP